VKSKDQLNCHFFPLIAAATEKVVGSVGSTEIVIIIAVIGWILLMAVVVVIVAALIWRRRHKYNIKMLALIRIRSGG
jgi:membrane protein YdbS with pleckstrin-like domain